MKYQTTQLEDWIKNFYHGLDIYHPRQLDLLEIAARLGLELQFVDIGSKHYKGIMIIDNRIPPNEQWQDFAHELCHALRHEGNQLYMSTSFLKLQENQAYSFMYHFCVPTFMLLKYEIANFTNIYDGVQFVAKTFNVTEDFAKTRLIHFKNQIQQAIYDEEHRKYMNSLYPKAPPYSEETNAMLAKLNLLTAKKKGVSA